MGIRSAASIKKKMGDIKKTIDLVAEQARRDAQRRRHYPNGLKIESVYDVLLFLSKVMFGEIETTSREIDAVELIGKQLGVWDKKTSNREVEEGRYHGPS